MRPAFAKTSIEIALFAGLVCLTAIPGCARFAAGQLANVLAAPGSTYASDEDPELVRDAVPFGLKTMEQVVAAQPRHVPLLTALAENFTEYTYAFVEQPADRLEETDVVAAQPLRERARRLYLRAREYGLRAIAVRRPALARALCETPSTIQIEALKQATREDVPRLYWIAAPWALAIGSAKGDMGLVGTLPIVEAIMARALALDESFAEGALHEFYISYFGGQGPAGARQAREHLARALALSHGKKLGPLVSFAETVSVAEQNRAEFRRLLGQVAAYEVDRDPPHRLANIISQRRAKWLLSRQNDLFAD